MNIDTIVARLTDIRNKTIPATERDQMFADSLLTGKYGYQKRGYLTANQERAAVAMIERIENPPPSDQMAGLSKVYSFFMKAREHLKYPRLMLTMGGRELKIYMSGQRSKYPDTINLVTEDDHGYLDLWLGRVFKDGEWQHRRGNEELHQQAADLLGRLAEDPAKVAAEHGHLTGNCCFCHRKLTDERSTSVGYGPVCATKWNVPWGAK